MIDAAHQDFRRWAAWVLAPVPHDNLGYGKSILQRIVEGRGQILPGAPKDGGISRIHTDAVASKVDAYLKIAGREDRYLMRTFYLSRYLTAEQKANQLKRPVKTMYNQVEAVHHRYLLHIAGSER